MTTPSLRVKRRNRRSDKYLRSAKKMANMRAAKARKKIERGPVEHEPRMLVVRHPHLSWAMRDDLSGDVVWMEFKSVRDMARRAGMVARFYLPRR